MKCGRCIRELILKDGWWTCVDCMRSWPADLERPGDLEEYHKGKVILPPDLQKEVLELLGKKEA